MSEVRPVLEGIFSYLKEHPEELLRALRNSLALRFGVPIVALRWLAGRVKGKKAPKDIEIAAAPPGVRLAASLDLMGTPVRASGVMYVENVSAGPEHLRLELRLSELSLKVLDDAVESPIAALLRSGALDLSKPGNLVAYMPKRPPILVEAKDDRIVLDLMRHPKLAQDARLRKTLGLLVPLVTVAAIETDPEHLDVALRAFPDGMKQVLSQLRRAF